MLLYLLRHGIAVDREDPLCPDDPERPLTEKGVRRTRRSVDGMRAAGARPKMILTSPYLRARQTARIAAYGLGLPDDVIVITEDLLPEAAPEICLRGLETYEGVDVLAVGHAPHLDDLLSTALRARAEILSPLKKAGAACIALADPDPGAGRLVWFMEPGILRRIGRRARTRG
jgi:phosphohistidine phosphatase